MKNFPNLGKLSVISAAWLPKIKGHLVQHKKLWIVIAAILVIGSVVIYFLTRPKPKPMPLPNVEVTAVDTTTVNIYGEYVGRIRAQQFVEVHARVEASTRINLNMYVASTTHTITKR